MFFDNFFSPGFFSRHIIDNSLREFNKELMESRALENIKETLAATIRRVYVLEQQNLPGNYTVTELTPLRRYPRKVGRKIHRPRRARYGNPSL